jgi:DNA-binding PadR family transcriptional regulator
LEISKELLKGHIDMLVLSLISKRDMYGYEIAKKVRIESSGAFELKEGTLYLALKRIEKQKWVISYWGNEQGPGGRRKYYQITDNGKNELEQKVREWEFIKNNIDIFLRLSKEG